MIFDNLGVLDSSARITFERATEGHIFDQVNGAGISPPLMELTVGTDVKSQSVVVNDGQGRRQRRRRRLQTTQRRIVFDVVVGFKSTTTYEDINAIIGDAFNSAAERNQYLDRLQRQGNNLFSSINDVQVEVGGVPQNEVDEEPNGIGLPVIIGSVAGGLSLVIVGMLVYIMYCRKRSKPLNTQSQATPTTVAASGERMNTEVRVEPQDEVSTLGDPTYTQGMAMAALEKDDTVTPSIVSGDYDYARKYGMRPTLTSSVADSARSADLLGSIDMSARGEASSEDLSAFGLAKMDTSLFSDDASFEQQFTEIETRFEVLAPAGKLGMVIDTPNGQVPVVHAIKDSSVLSDTVQVGDRLISVDDEETTMMTAMQVSKLISAKADNPSRTLVFARTRNRAGTEELIGA